MAYYKRVVVEVSKTWDLVFAFTAVLSRFAQVMHRNHKRKHNYIAYNYACVTAVYTLISCAYACVVRVNKGTSSYS